MKRLVKSLLLAVLLAASVVTSALTPSQRVVVFSGVRPTLDLNFLNGVLDSRITASGGANGTRVNSAGTIVAATTPRFDYDPVSLAPKGLLVEEARTNILANSKIDGTTLSTQTVTVTATPYTLSFYGTGTVTLSGASTAGPLVGTGAYPTRVSLTFTPSAGTLTATVAGTVQYANLEAGSFATSFIPTVAAVTRTADSLTMTGANFSDWFNASAGTFITEQTRPAAAIADGVVLHVDDGTLSERFAFGSGATGSVQNPFVVDGGVVQATLTQAVGSALGTKKLAFAYAANAFSASVGGATPITDAAGTLPTVTTLRVGSGIGNNHWNGHLRTLRFYSTRLPNATLQSLTN